MKKRNDFNDSFEMIDHPNHDPYGYQDDLKRSGKRKIKKQNIRNKRRQAEARKRNGW